MNIQPCKKLCVECGFVRGSQRGTLQPELIEVAKSGTIFPCHMKLRAVTGSENEGVHYYAKVSPVFEVCRGYVECMIISGMVPPGETWKKLVESIGDNFTEGLMTFDEVCEYHLGNEC